MTHFIEKRLAKRIPTSRPVVVMLNKQNLYATLTDFSKRGLGILIDTAVPLNERVEVHFDIEVREGIHHFQFKAEVKHCIHLQHQNHIGVKLDLPSLTYQTIYESLAAA